MKPSTHVPRGERGVACPDCGCKRLMVVYTRHHKVYTLRRRQCRYCGRRIVTHEKIAEKVTDM